MDLGDTPDVIHQDRKQKLMTGDHPLGQHPSLSQQAQSKLATHGYKQAMSKVGQYNGGRTPRTLHDVARAGGDLFGTLRKTMQVEAAHKEELQNLAIETVLRMPEFASVRKHLQAGEFKIKAILGPANLQGTRMSDAPEEEEEEGEEGGYTPAEVEVPEIQQEVDDAVLRRRFVNAMIQGAAVTNNYAFAYYAGDELNQIDPQLVPDYGKLMSLSELGYWVQGDEVVRQAAANSGGESQGGSEELTQDEDGVVLVARGLTFPMLVHELIKGLMEHLSHNDDEDRETRNLVRDKADFIDEETWSMLLGPGIWKQFLDAIGGESRDIMPHLYDEVIKMPNNQFNALMKGVVEGSPQAKRQFQALAVKVRQDLGGDNSNESQARQIVRNMLG